MLPAMARPSLPTLVLCLALTGVATAVPAASPGGTGMTPVAPVAPGLLPTLQRLAPEADPRVLALALEARECALAQGRVADASRLGVIDYSRPSTERRLWVFDLRQPRLLFAEHVAHGRNSGENHARAFSNAEGSYQSSLGLFSTAEPYMGGNGYSLRMDGLEPGVNDHARARAIVMHGAPYVNPVTAAMQGRLGRSLGCPAVRPEVAREVIDALKDGQLVFAYYPDQAWLGSSRFLRCGGLARREAPAGRGAR